MSRIRKHRLLLAIFPALFLVFIHSAIADAHALGQPSFFKINGEYAGYNNILFPSPFFLVPQDKAPENYLVNQELDCEIDTVPLQIPLDVLNQTPLHWDFGDGTTAQGFKNSHRYANPGSYVITITMPSDSGPPLLLESALVQVLPYVGYQLPKAVIAVNNKLIGDPMNDIMELPFSKPILFNANKSTVSSKIVSYTWDFGDQTSSEQPVCQHQYAGGIALQAVCVILRVKDAYDFFSDTYAEVDFQDANGQAVAPLSAPGAASTTPNQNATEKEPISTNTVATNSPQKSMPSQPLKQNMAFAPGQQSAPTITKQQSLIDRIVAQINDLSRDFISSILNANTGGLLALAFLLAFLAGGLHALAPGHGKSIMAVSLGGKKGSGFNDVLLLAGSITFTHTIVIFLLGFVFLVIDRSHSLVDALPYFEKFGALVVAILGVNLIRNGWHNLRDHDHSHVHNHDHHDHNHAHVHAHPHPHGHTDNPSPNGTGRDGKGGVLLAGFAGGIVPCSDAFALLLLLVSAGKALLGIVFVLVFSTGLACTIVMLGILMVIGKRSFNLEGRLGRAAETYAPLVSGILLLAIAIRLLL